MGIFRSNNKIFSGARVCFWGEQIPQGDPEIRALKKRYDTNKFEFSVGKEKVMNDKIARKRNAEGGDAENGRLFNDVLIDPAIIAGYSKTMPGAPQKIFVLMEEQARHERWIEKLNTWNNFIRSVLGLVFAAALTLCFLAGGVLCIMYNHDYAGTAIIGSTLTGLVATFIYGTKNHQ